MAIQSYDTHTLQGVIRTLPPPSNFWLNLCFPVSIPFDDEYIDFDVIDRGRRLAPFVAPTAQGKPLLQKGYSTRRFRPAYIKPKDSVDPRRLFKRRAGEAYTGTMTPQARRNAIVADILQTHRDAHERRQEWMAASAIINDLVEVSGPDYPTQVISFGRHPSQTITLTGTAQWSDPSANPVKNLDAWIGQVQQRSSYAPTRVVMGTDAWDVFRDNPVVEKKLDTRRGSETRLETAVGTGEVVQYKGTLGASLEVWTYNDIYEDDEGNVVPFMDPKKIVLLNPTGTEGVRCFGAILDADAGYVPTEFFPKMFKENDPSAEFILTQSAPLMVPRRPNAVLVAKVLQ